MSIPFFEDNRVGAEQIIAQSELSSLAKEFSDNNTRLGELSKITRDLTPEESAEKLSLVKRNHQVVVRQQQIMAQNGSVIVGGGVTVEN